MNATSLGDGSPRTGTEPGHGTGADRALRVVHLNPLLPPPARDPGRVLEEWWSLTDVARAVAEAGCHVTVLQPARQEADFRKHGVRFLFVKERGESNLRRRLGFWAHPIPARTLDLVDRLAPDVIHFHSLSFPRHLRRLQRELPHTPVLVQDHADRPPPRWRSVLHRRAFRDVAGVAFTAAAQAEPFLEAGVLPAHVPVFEILESSSRFRPGDREEARRETGLYGDPCLLWLGNLSPVKDPLTVLDALARVVDRLPDAQLWCFYRSAPLLDAVRKAVASDPRLADRVHLEGAVGHEEVEPLLRSADFLLQGSLREGSGYAVVEALACGTPPLVTDIPSFRVITGGGRVGALSPPGDAEAMARAIAEWAARDRTLLRQRAREHFEEALSFTVVGRRLRDAYGALVAKRRGAGESA